MVLVLKIGSAAAVEVLWRLYELGLPVKVALTHVLGF